ncbi:hypothetical protein EPI10_032398 [Gossypium australe]|uniref:Uncharacterized protein n=1 Tax=Gossypium australe TaxID=47621 RepID=A0A5B6X342_9ROSI|nr:hypothetical protein EPI10_032398 [Gossypium australe]
MLHQRRWLPLSLVSVASDCREHHRIVSKDVGTVLFCIPAPRTRAVTNYSSQAQVLEVRDEVPRNTPDRD